MDSLLSGAKGFQVCQKVELVELYRIHYLVVQFYQPPGEKNAN